MKQYELILTGNKKIIISERDKETIDRYWRKGESMLLDIGRNRIDTSTIKGIFEIEDNMPQNISEYYKEMNRKFYEQLRSEISNPAEWKAKREMKTRILPGWNLSGGKREDDVMMDIYKKVLDFFIKNNNHVYCPAFVWWNELKKQDRKLSDYFRIILRHDKQVNKQYYLKRG